MLETMSIGKSSIIHTSENSNGSVTRRWTREINGTPFSFTVVNMPDGELRLIVKYYNGYGEDTEVGREVGMKFSCAWDQYKWITIKPV